MKTRLFCLLIFCLLSITACKPDGGINGKVTYTDYYDGCDYPAASTLVYSIHQLSNGKQQNKDVVTSDKYGHFEFKHVADGDWIIKAKLNREDVVYEGVSETLHISDGEIINTQLHLHMSGISYASR